MKKNNSDIHYKKCLKLFICIVFYLLSVSVYGQQPGLCGGYKINTAELNKALQFERNNTAKASGKHYLVRVYFHIVTYNDGSNPSATEEDIKNEFAALQSDYASANICFLKAGVNYINNTALDTVNVDNTGSTLFAPYRVPNCINIFYIYKINGNNVACGCSIGGTSFTIPSTICAVWTGNIGQGHTVSHETGHCLGLLHTFETANGVEDIDGSNSSTAGDQIIDTHADPYSYLGQTCFSTAGSIYNGSCTDPKGRSNYSPPYTNTMSYWWIYGYPNSAFTSDQFTRINSFLNTNSDLTACESPDYVTVSANTYGSGYLMTSALYTLTSSGTVIISGSAVATLGGQTVSLENGFDAYPQKGGFVAIEASSCNFTANKIIADNSSSIKIYSPGIFPGLIVYPNPTSSVIHLDFTIDKNENNVITDVFNMEMQKVKEIRSGDLLKGTQSVTINLNGLPPGVYFIMIQLQSQKLNAKVLLVK